MIQLAAEWLLDELRGVVDCPVVTLVPRKAHPLFVRVDSAAFTAVSPASQVGLAAVQVYGSDLDQVVDTLLTIRMHLFNGVYDNDEKLLGWEEEAGPHLYPDPDIPDKHRWQITGQLITTLT